MKTYALLLLAYFLVLLAAMSFMSCAGPGGVLMHATLSGQGDVRSDGDVVVVVGGLAGSAGLRVAGQPLLLLPAFAVDEGHWYVRSASHNYEAMHLLSEPLPAWVRPLFSDADLAALAVLGIHLSFES